MIGDCLDASLQHTVALMDTTSTLFNPNLFVNPQASMVANIFTAGSNRQSAVFDLISSVGSPPTLGAANDSILLYNGISRLCGGQLIAPVIGMPPFHPVLGAQAPYPAMGQYHAMNQFLSGKLSIFPAGLIDPGLVPNLAIIGTMTFAGMLGAARGGQVTDGVLCQTDPNDPCKRINDIFASILGAYNTVLGLIQAGLNDILLTVAQIEAFISQMIAAVVNGIGALVNAFLQAIRYGLAKLLNALKLDPCLQSVITGIAGPDLQQALGI